MASHLFPYLFVLLCFLVSADSRLRFKYRKRPECRDNWPRRPEEVPSHVISGVIEQTFSVPGSSHYAASVYAKWVIKGNQVVDGSRITVDGFLPGDPCSPDIKKGDSLILQVEPSAEGLYHLNGTIFKVNLNNLDRIQAILADRPFRRRPDITEQPCEVQYCPHNGDCVEDSNGARCICPTNCSHNYEPVCGSNGQTFVNECQLRADTCLRGQNVFIRHVGPCEAKRAN